MAAVASVRGNALRAITWKPNVLAIQAKP
jgi:hypothetical protein